MWDCSVIKAGAGYHLFASRWKKNLGFGAQWLYNSEVVHCVSDKPEGPYEFKNVVLKRLSDMPILQFESSDFHIEDPYLWYDTKREKFCLIAKDDVKNGTHGITGEWGSGFYAESDDCINFEIAPEPKVYSRNVEWENGSRSLMCNLERPSLLFDDSGNPTHLFCASGDGTVPYEFTGDTFILCFKLEKAE